jgi:hypothetical protein
MKDEYDFSRAERGKFYRADAVFELPVYLDAAVAKALTELATREGRDLNELVSHMIEQERRQRRVGEPAVS